MFYAPESLLKCSPYPTPDVLVGDGRGDFSGGGIDAAGAMYGGHSAGIELGAAALAVDGDTSTSFHGGMSCTRTQAQHSPWWRVDLGAAYPVERVRLWGRAWTAADWMEAERRAGRPVPLRKKRSRTSRAQESACRRPR